MTGPVGMNLAIFIIRVLFVGVIQKWISIKQALWNANSGVKNCES